MCNYIRAVQFKGLSSHPFTKFRDINAFCLTILINYKSDTLKQKEAVSEGSFR